MFGLAVARPLCLNKNQKEECGKKLGSVYGCSTTNKSKLTSV